MSEEMTAAATPSTAESTSTEPVANQSTESVTTSDTMTPEDFESSIDSDWGIVNDEVKEEAEIATNDEAEEEPVAEENPDEQEPEEIEEETAEDTQPTVPTLSVNFLGKSYDLPEDEARKYAQIGMNAGRLQEKYDALKPLEPLRDALEVMAIFQGRPVQDVVNELGSLRNLKDAEIAALVQDGHDEALAEELFNSRLRESQQKQQLEKMRRPQQQGLSLYQKEQIEQFARMRPEENEKVMQGKALPDDVLTEWRNGTPLTEAWLMHENNEYQTAQKDLEKQIKDLQKQLKEAKSAAKKLQKNNENKTKAPTSKKGTGGGNGSGTDIWAAWSKL